MLQHYIEMKGDTEEYKKYLDDILNNGEKIPLDNEEKAESK